MNNKKYIYLVMTLAIIGGFATMAPIIAMANQQGGGNNPEQGQVPAVVGRVSTINGNTITVISKQGFGNRDANTTFTVNTTNAQFLTGNTAIALSSISVGDTVTVQGVVTGTNVVATIIRDGKVGNGNASDNNQAMLQIQGNGQPVVAGTVSAINGLAISVTNSGNVAYIVDAANAKIVQGKNTILLSGVKIGDSVIVQGTVNGASISATTIIDANATAGQKTHLGFFGSIGQFFRNLFGF